MPLRFHLFDYLIMRQNANNVQGFTLIEMAVVLAIIGIVMTMGLKMVVATLENASYSETKSKQEQIKLALIGYLRTNGTLPCPDNSDSSTVATGAAAATCKNTAAEGYGIVPWQTLGIPRGSVIDAWGNYFTYRVANSGGGVSKNWTGKAPATTDFTVNELTSPADALTIQELNAAGTALTNTTPKAVVVILSHGQNGFGAKTTKVGPRLPTTDAGTDEGVNATVGTTTFVLRPVDKTAAGNGYDDLLAYLLPQDLLQPLVSEGTLKACVAYCPERPSCTDMSGTFSCTAGVGYCDAGGPACTAGTMSCSVGAPQCVPPGVGCAPSSVPIGATPATCS